MELMTERIVSIGRKSVESSVDGVVFLLPPIVAPAAVAARSPGWLILIRALFKITVRGHFSNFEVSSE